MRQTSYSLRQHRREGRRIVLRQGRACKHHTRLLLLIQLSRGYGMLWLAAY